MSNMADMNWPPVLDVCCGSKMFYFNKDNEDVFFKEMNQKELEEWFENLPWHEAIFVLIGSVE